MLTTTYDKQNDVLRIFPDDMRAYALRDHPLDNDLTIGLDKERRVIGIKLRHASALCGIWPVHPARHGLPGELRAEVARALAQLECIAVDPDLCASRPAV